MKVEAGSLAGHVRSHVLRTLGTWGRRILSPLHPVSLKHCMHNASDRIDANCSCIEGPKESA